jgi:hypothetical protein
MSFVSSIRTWLVSSARVWLAKRKPTRASQRFPQPSHPGGGGAHRRPGRGPGAKALEKAVQEQGGSVVHAACPRPPRAQPRRQF